MPLASIRSLILLSLLVVPCLAQIFTGRVVGITHGDTITFLDSNKKQSKVRLAEIDAPDKLQPFWRESKKHLSNLVFGKNVTVNGRKHYRYGRMTAKVLLKGRDVNLEMVRTGYSWWYRDYSNEQSTGDRETYNIAEQSARGSQLILWSELDPTPPWESRKGTRLIAADCSQHGGCDLGPAEIVGNRNSKIYHWNPGCPDFFKIASKNRVKFYSMA